jgi:glyoxylase-like metal-dependent hydrolase (beta-lactamase superfamily II)
VAVLDDRSGRLGTAQLTKDQIDGAIASARRHLRAIESRLRTVDSDAEVVPGIRALATPGHTPGHLSFLVWSEGASLLVMGDLAHHHALQIAHPDWSTCYDTQPEITAQSRRRIFAELAQSRMLAIGSHLPFPGLGHLRPEADGYAWVPLPWRSEG